jgi:hypothetical protein
MSTAVIFNKLGIEVRLSKLKSDLSNKKMCEAFVSYKDFKIGSLVNVISKSDFDVQQTCQESWII